MLNVHDHSRESAGLRYVYPVVSRRAGGVSVGINLNVNNACNWACIYCQVPGLTRGGPLPIDLQQLEAELRSLLQDIVHGDFMRNNVPAEARYLIDVAFSGNGEPTSAPEFADAVVLVEHVLRDFGLLECVKLRLITNGSLMHRAAVTQGITGIARIGGEVWFKLDRATLSGIERVNGIRLSPEKIKESLVQCCELAATWVQTCYFAVDSEEAGEDEQMAYLELLEGVKGKIMGVHLYGLARPSLQPEAARLSALAPESFQRFAARISALGIKVVANP